VSFFLAPLKGVFAGRVIRSMYKKTNKQTVEAASTKIPKKENKELKVLAIQNEPQKTNKQTKKGKMNASGQKRPCCHLGTQTTPPPTFLSLQCGTRYLQKETNFCAYLCAPKRANLNS